MDEQMPKHSGRWLVYKNVQSESPTWFTEEMDALDYLAAMRNGGYSVSLFREVNEMVMCSHCVSMQDGVDHAQETVLRILDGDVNL